MTKQDINEYHKLNKRIKEEAKNLLKWYNNLSYAWIDGNDYYFIYLTDDNKLWYENYIYTEPKVFTLPVKLLWLSEYERDAWYFNKIKEEE